MNFVGANNERKALKLLITCMDLDSKMNGQFQFPSPTCMDFDVAKLQHLERFGDMAMFVDSKSL